MRAITVGTGRAQSVQLQELAEPPGQGDVEVEMLAVGVCGTDREIIDGVYGEAPPGSERLVLGHESLGRVTRAPADSGLQRGDLVVGIVRRPDPVPCSNCAIGEWDMCRNGRYTEHGIKGLHGFMAERVRLSPEELVRVDPVLRRTGVLLEPASILAKAWEHIERIGARSRWAPRSVLVTGAGPIGLLAALMAAQRGLEVHVLDRTTTGPKPELVRALGGHYHTGPIEEACRGVDVILECTGAGALVFGAMTHIGPNGIVCLTGVSAGRRDITVDGAGINRELVLSNNVVFGTVNANRGHYEQAAAALARAEPGWLERLITRRVRLDRWPDAFERRPGDVKTILEFGE